MAKPFLSVIVPVYNVGSYLSACLYSLSRQGFRDFEVILVDDGSTDDSPTLCREFEQKDSRFCAYHQENQGVSAARNAGLALAKGSYVTFVDADDYVQPDYLQTLAADAAEHDADIVCCNYLEVCDGKEQSPLFHIKQSREIRHEDLLEIAYAHEGFGTMVWGKLIRTENAREVQFQSLKYGEDSLYVAHLFSLPCTVYTDIYEGYRYVLRQTGAMMSGKGSVNAVMHPLIYKEYLFKQALLHPSQAFRKYAADSLAGSIYFASSSVMCSGKKQLYRETREELLGYIDLLLSSGQPVCTKYRTLILLYRSFPALYLLTVQVWNRLSKKTKPVCFAGKREI